MLPFSNLIKGHIMGLYLLKGYVDTWLMSKLPVYLHFEVRNSSKPTKTAHSQSKQPRNKKEENLPCKLVGCLVVSRRQN